MRSPDDLGAWKFARASSWLVAYALLLHPVQTLFAQGDAPAEPIAPTQQLLIVPVSGKFNAGVVASLKQRVESTIAENPDVAWVIFDLDLDSDDFEAAWEFARFIDEGSTFAGKTTIAYLQQGKRALGAAVLPLLACHEIAIGPQVVIGAGSEVNPLVPKDIRERFGKIARRLADKRGRSGTLAQLMIESAGEPMFRLKRRDADVIATERFTFFTQTDLNTADKSELQRKYFPYEPFVDRGDHVTLDEDSAGGDYQWYGWARHRGIEDENTEYAAICVKMDINLGPQDLIHLDRGRLGGSSQSLRQIAQILQHPASRFVLILFGVLGILIELKMFGTIVPGIVGVLCFTLFFTAGMMPDENGLRTTSLFEIALFVIGLGLLFTEFLVLPGVAVFAVSGAMACCVSLVLAMIPGGEAAVGSKSKLVWDAVSTLAYGFGGSAAAFMLLLRFLPKSSFAKGIVTRATIEGVPSADSAESSASVLAALVGKLGTADTPLRPAGKVQLDSGRVLDVVADGEFIERGEKVVVRACQSTRIVVSRARQDKNEPLARPE